MSGDTDGAILKTGRNKNRKKNQINFSTSKQAGEGAEPGSWEYPPGTTDFGMAVPVHTPLKKTKGKKRNNTVSGMEQGGGAAPKKTKQDVTPVSKSHDSKIFRNSFMKKHQKNWLCKDQMDNDMELTPSTSSSVVPPKKFKCKTGKAKRMADEDKQSNEAGPAEIKTDGTNNTQSKKQRKRRRQKKHAKMETDGEPMLKIKKQLTLEEDLAEVMENMQIDIDETVPADPEPCESKPEEGSHKRNTNVDANSNEFDLEKVVKWTKKNWKKECITAATLENQNSTVVIENVPAVMYSVYRTKLIEVFQKYGQIKDIGPAEMQDSDDANTTFNTTICFVSEEAAIKALGEDSSHIGGNVIRVRRPMPVVGPPRHRVNYGCCCYYDVPIENLRSIFGGYGLGRATRAAAAGRGGMDNGSYENEERGGRERHWQRDGRQSE